MKATTEEGVKLREKINKDRPRSIHGLSGIHEGDYADALANLDPNAPVRFSFLEDSQQDQNVTKRPFYFTLQNEDNNGQCTVAIDHKGYDDIELHIPEGWADRDKTLELAKQGIVYSTVERKKRRKAAEVAKKDGNYESPASVTPVNNTSNYSALVRRDSRKRVVKEMYSPGGTSNPSDGIYGVLQRTPSQRSKCSAYGYEQLGHGGMVNHRMKSASQNDLLRDNDYDQIVRSNSDLPHSTMTLAADVHQRENIYDQLDRKTEDFVVVDTIGHLMRKDSKRSANVYDRVERNESFAPNSVSKNIRCNYDQLERSGEIFIPVSPQETVIAKEEVPLSTTTPPIQEHIYGHLNSFTSYVKRKAKSTMQKSEPERSEGNVRRREHRRSKLLNRFRFSGGKWKDTDGKWKDTGGKWKDTNASTPSTHCKNVTYADFWLDFSLKTKVQEYLKAANSNNNYDDDDAEGGCVGNVECLQTCHESESNDDHGSNMDVLTVDYECVMSDAECDQDSSCGNTDRIEHVSDDDVNMHCQLQKGYSKIHDHMQNKFCMVDSLNIPRCTTSANDGYAELRLPNVDQSGQVSENIAYDRLHRTNDAKSMAEGDTSHCNEGIDSKNQTDTGEQTAYEQLANDTGPAYDILNRTPVPQHKMKNRKNSDGHLDTESSSPAGRHSEQDEWVIVGTEKQGRKSNAKEMHELKGDNKELDSSPNSKSGKLPHHYSNTSIYEDIWPGQQ